MKFVQLLSKNTIALIVLITIIVSSNINWGKDNWKGIIESDAKGYYAYLPATFIYHDLNFGFFDEIEKDKYYNKNLYYNYRSKVNGKYINKYYSGTALAQMPFFLIAHFSSYLLDYEMDGYSKLYPIFVNIAALFYLLVGLIYLNKSLKLYGTNQIHRAICVLATAFGTHLFYYSIIEPGMSHVYSFGFISMFIYYLKSYFTSFQKRDILYLGIILGIVLLIRPVNGLIIFSIPFISGSFKNLKKGVSTLFNHKTWLILSICFCIGLIAVQFIIYKISTGSFFVYSYKDEGFNFLSPHFIDILFSYKKGLFLYTPILFAALLGLYFLMKQSVYQFFTWIGFFTIVTYILSSWWMWYYGGSFSSRVFVEYIPMLILLMAMALNKINGKGLKRIYTSLIVALIFVCQIQTYQYRYYQIHWVDMNKEKYWEVFLRIDKLIS